MAEIGDVGFVEEDFVGLKAQPGSKKKPKLTLVFGDKVEVTGKKDGWTKLKALTHFDGDTEGWARGDPPLRDNGLLKLSMVDVQQGDGLILETPDGKIVFIDGGDNKLFARHAAWRFRHRGTSATSPLEVDALLITHGDADHFDGLNQIKKSERLGSNGDRKRLFIHPKRVLHNGIVKGPSSLSDSEQLGRKVRASDGKDYVIDLYDDPRKAIFETRPVNTPFKRWFETLDHWETRGSIAFHRIDHTSKPAEAFDFLHEEGISVDIQGPFTKKIKDPDDGTMKPALPFFHKPKKSAEIHLEEGDGAAARAISASHTINGHSLALRLTFGNVRIQLTGDLNQEAMALMAGKVPPEDLEAEIVKAPHHGSHDFDFKALKSMSPITSLVSSGDESAVKEHIHPRATLMNALGKVSRGNTGLIFNTELVAFFN